MVSHLWNFSFSTSYIFDLVCAITVRPLSTFRLSVLTAAPSPMLNFSIYGHELTASRATCE